MSISVALCTYNGAFFIERQLRSILNQTIQPDEIVVSDDGSQDQTLPIIERVYSEWRQEHKESAPQLRIIKNAGPVGVTANFQQALAACSGDIIALSDQDDVWHPERIERVLAEFADRPDLLLVHCDARLVDEAGHPTGKTVLGVHGVSDAEQAAVRRGRALDSLLRRNIATGATMTIRKNLLKTAMPFPASWVHDEWLAMVAALLGGVDLLPESLIDYRQHGGNQIGASTLGISGKLRRLMSPRSTRNARLLQRAVVLQTRAAEFRPSLPSATLALLGAKVDHERARSAFPAARFKRVLPVTRQWRAGAYGRFGLGPQDIIRDLLQPAG